MSVRARAERVIYTRARVNMCRHTLKKKKKKKELPPQSGSDVTGPRRQLVDCVDVLWSGRAAEIDGFVLVYRGVKRARSLRLTSTRPS